MTSIPIRVLVDWDNDGFFNPDTTKQNKPNLIPDSPYYNYPRFLPYYDNDFNYNLEFRFSQVVGNFEYGIRYDVIYFHSTMTKVYYGCLRDYATTYIKTPDAFPIQLTPNLPYTFSIYLKNVDIAKKCVINLYAAELGTTNLNLLGTYTFDNIPTDWQQYSFTFTSPSYNSSFFISIEAYYDDGGSGALPTLLNQPKIGFAGMQLTQSDTVLPFNLSTQLQGYDNITEDILYITCRTGKDDFLNSVGYEGDCEITLNNVSKKYSPENENSPLYGFFKQDLPIRIEFYHETDEQWYSLWHGAITQYEIEPSTTLERRAYIRAKQGLYKLRNQKVSTNILVEQDFQTNLLTLLEFLNLRLMGYPLQGIVNFSRLDINAYVADTIQVFDVIENTFVPQLLVGDGWDIETSVEDAIKELLLINGSHLNINKNGKIELRNADYYYNIENNYDLNINLDTDVQNANYVWGENIINRVIISIKPKKEETNVVVFETKEPVYVGNRGRNKASIIIDPRFDENKYRTITYISDKKSDVTFTFYKNTKPFGKLVNPLTGSAHDEAEDAIDYTLNKLSDGRYEIILINNHPTKTYYVDVAVKGNYILGGDRQQFVFEDTDSINAINNIFEKVIETDLISTEEEAKFLANRILDHYGKPRGQFTSIELYNQLDYLRDISINSRLLISETQTDEETIPHVVMGYQFDIDSSYNIKITYNLFRTANKKTLHIGDTVISVNEGASQGDNMKFALLVSYTDNVVEKRYNTTYPEYGDTYYSFLVPNYSYNGIVLDFETTDHTIVPTNLMFPMHDNTLTSLTGSIDTTYPLPYTAQYPISYGRKSIIYPVANYYLFGQLHPTDSTVLEGTIGTDALQYPEEMYMALLPYHFDITPTNIYMDVSGGFDNINMTPYTRAKLFFNTTMGTKLNRFALMFSRGSRTKKRTDNLPITKRGHYIYSSGTGTSPHRIVNISFFKLKDYRYQKYGFQQYNYFTFWAQKEVNRTTSDLNMYVSAQIIEESNTATPKTAGGLLSTNITQFVTDLPTIHPSREGYSHYLTSLFFYTGGAITISKNDRINIYGWAYTVDDPTGKSYHEIMSAPENYKGVL